MTWNFFAKAYYMNRRWNKNKAESAMMIDNPVEETLMTDNIGTEGLLESVDKDFVPNSHLQAHEIDFERLEEPKL